MDFRNDLTLCEWVWVVNKTGLRLMDRKSRPESSSLAPFENFYSKRPAAAGSVEFHTLQRNEETKHTTKWESDRVPNFLMSFMRSRDFFEVLSELPNALLFHQICSFLHFSGGRNMLCTGEKIIGRVWKKHFADFKDSRGLIDEKHMIKLKQICFSPVQNDLCLHTVNC